MARTGITYIDVEHAAQQLQGSGKNPTVDGVRELLGTGSKSTIAQHLRTWKNDQSPDQAALPQELLSLVAGLWEKVNVMADDRVSHIEQEARTELAQLSQTVNTLRQELTQLSQQKLSLDEACVLKERQLDALSGELSDEKQKTQALSIQQEAQLVQLHDMKKENERLHQLASNIQANLEHYQASVQQLQIEQNLIVEKQQAFFQQQMHELEIELKQQRQKALDLDYALQASTSEAQAVKQALASQQSVNEVLVKSAQETSVALTKSDFALEQQRAVLVETQGLFQQMQKQCQMLSTQHAVTQDQYQRLQAVVQQKEDTIELLRQEKLFLIQENAELKGYLKRLDTKKATPAHVD